MTTCANTVLALLIATTLFWSCGDSENNTEGKEKRTTAIQDEMKVRSFGKSGTDSPEALYQGLVSETPALKSLEEDLEVLGEKPYVLKEQVEKYDRKSGSYYNSAASMANTVADSLLRKKINNLLAKSNSRYDGKKTELNALMELLSRNSATLRDYHIVLKIALTIPLIEKYQDEHLPDRQQFRDLIKEQERLVKRVDALTPKH